MKRLTAITLLGLATLTAGTGCGARGGGGGGRGSTIQRTVDDGAARDGFADASRPFGQR